jgi:hypothetical protein
LIVQTDWQQQFVIFNSGKVIGEKSYTGWDAFETK